MLRHTALIPLVVVMFLSLLLLTSFRQSTTNAQSTTTATTAPPNSTNTSNLNSSLSVFVTLNETTFPSLGSAQFSIDLADILNCSTLDMYMVVEGNTSITIYFTTSSNAEELLAKITNSSILTSSQLTSLCILSIVKLSETTTTQDNSGPVETPTPEKAFPERDIGAVIGATFGWLCLILVIVLLWKKYSNRRKDEAYRDEMERTIRDPNEGSFLGEKLSDNSSMSGGLESNTSAALSTNNRKNDGGGIAGGDGRRFSNAFAESGSFMRLQAPQLTVNNNTNDGTFANHVARTEIPSSSNENTNNTGLYRKLSGGNVDTHKIHPFDNSQNTGKSASDGMEYL